MLWSVLFGLALAEDAPTTPPMPDSDAVHGAAFAAGGIIAGGFGFTLGVQGDARAGIVLLEGEASLGGRTPAILGGFPQKPGVALGSIGLALDARDPSGIRFGLVALLDVAVVDAAEEDCEGPSGECRHHLWLGTEDLPVGASLSPGGAIRLQQTWDDGTHIVASAGLQDHRIYGGWDLTVGPRADTTVYTNTGWMVGAFMRRHGLGLRMGRVLR